MLSIGHLLLYLSNGGDGITKNFYIYKMDEETPFRIALWDCDHSFGRDGDNETECLPINTKFFKLHFVSEVNVQ